MNYLVVNQDTRRVSNVIVWDGQNQLDIPGCYLVNCDDAPGAWIGWQLIDGQWIAPTEEATNGSEESS